MSLVIQTVLLMTYSQVIIQQIRNGILFKLFLPRCAIKGIAHLKVKIEWFSHKMHRDTIALYDEQAEFRLLFTYNRTHQL